MWCHREPVELCRIQSYSRLPHNEPSPEVDGWRVTSENQQDTSCRCGPGETGKTGSPGLRRGLTMDNEIKWESFWNTNWRGEAGTPQRESVCQIRCSQKLFLAGFWEAACSLAPAMALWLHIHGALTSPATCSVTAHAYRKMDLPFGTIMELN